MRNHLIHAPVNATTPSPEVNILDSACNDGTWMLDVIMERTTQLQVQPDIKLNFLGTDLDQKHFSDLDLSSTLTVERQQQIRPRASALRIAVSWPQRRD